MPNLHSISFELFLKYILRQIKGLRGITSHFVERFLVVTGCSLKSLNHLNNQVGIDRATKAPTCFFSILLGKTSIIWLFLEKMEWENLKPEEALGGKALRKHLIGYRPYPFG